MPITCSPRPWLILRHVSFALLFFFKHISHANRILFRHVFCCYSRAHEYVNYRRNYCVCIHVLYSFSPYTMHLHVLSWFVVSLAHIITSDNPGVLACCGRCWCWSFFDARQNEFKHLLRSSYWQVFSLLEVNFMQLIYCVWFIAIQVYDESEKKRDKWVWYWTSGI